MVEQQFVPGQTLRVAARAQRDRRMRGRLLHKHWCRSSHSMRCRAGGQGNLGRTRGEPGGEDVGVRELARAIINHALVDGDPEQSAPTRSQMPAMHKPRARPQARKVQAALTGQSQKGKRVSQHNILTRAQGCVRVRSRHAATTGADRRQQRGMQGGATRRYAILRTAIFLCFLGTGRERTVSTTRQWPNLREREKTRETVGQH